jgi:hypothetical protein
MSTKCYTLAQVQAVNAFWKNVAAIASPSSGANIKTIWQTFVSGLRGPGMPRGLDSLPSVTKSWLEYDVARFITAARPMLTQGTSGDLWGIGGSGPNTSTLYNIANEAAGRVLNRNQVHLCQAGQGQHHIQESPHVVQMAPMVMPEALSPSPSPSALPAPPPMPPPAPSPPPPPPPPVQARVQIPPYIWQTARAALAGDPTAAQQLAQCKVAAQNGDPRAQQNREYFRIAIRQLGSDPSSLYSA